MENPAKKLYEVFGSRSEIAQAFGKTSNEAIRLWEINGIPTTEALNAERLTGGKITAYEVLQYAYLNKAAA